MCGVFGIIGEYSPSKARSALSVLHHRGRDHCGIVEEKAFFFAHQRLSITDIHPRAHQPMRRGNIKLSFNGEIYNHNELRARLEPYPWETCSDAEVLIAAYEKWGIGCLEHLEGMFAFALHDGQMLHLVRDRFGKKPLFYLHTSEAFYFASEIKALKPFLKSVELNDDAMMSYLRFLAPTPPHTFYQGIEKLESGERLCFHNGKIEKFLYYDPLALRYRPQTEPMMPLTAIEEELHRSVRMRLDTEAPVAALLSGGIDSAMICAIAARQGKKLPVYTLGYDEYAGYDERSNAAESARYLGLEQSEVILSRSDFDGALDTFLAHMDEPLNDPAALPLYMLMRKIAQDGYKVVLSGEGSDELFLGYRQYFEYLDIEKAAMLHHKNWLKRYFKTHFSMNREWEWYKRIFEGNLLFRTSGEKFTDLQLDGLMQRYVRDNEGYEYLRPYRDRFESGGQTDPALWYSTIDLKLFLGEHFLVKLDRVSMAHTLEARSPFLDHTLAETVLSLDTSTRIGEGGTKFLLKKIAENYLSEAIIGRKKKGFSNPYMEWLIASERISLIREVNKKTGLFRDEILERYIGYAHRGKFKQHVWGLYVLSDWIKREML